MIQRGSIAWLDFGARRGSAPAGRRPVVVVQSDAFNRSMLGSVVVAALTTNLGLARFPGNVLLDDIEAGLPEPSLVNVTQLAAVDRRHLSDPIGAVPPRDMARVDAGLGLVLGLYPTGRSASWAESPPSGDQEDRP